MTVIRRRRPRAAYVIAWVLFLPGGVLFSASSQFVSHQSSVHYFIIVTSRKSAKDVRVHTRGNIVRGGIRVQREVEAEGGVALAKSRRARMH